jgi:hypothetical protein
MICAVKLDSAFIFLDPTIDFSTPFVVNDNIEGKECIIEDGSNYIIETIPSTPYSVNLLKIKNDIRMKGDQLIVNGNISLKGQLKNMFQFFLNFMGTEARENLIDYFVTNTDNNIFIEELHSPPLDTLVDNFAIDYSLVVSNNVLDIGDDILLKLDFYDEFRNAKIDSVRKYDYSFTSRQLKQQEIYFNIPANTVVFSTPDSLLIVHPKYEFSANYAVQDSVLIYRKKISIKNSILSRDEFEGWNNAIDQLVKFYNEMIILRKQ